MSEEPFAAVAPLLAEHAELEQELADPALHADAASARRVGRRYAELRQVVGAYRAWAAARDDAGAAVELAAEDPSFGDEAADARPTRRRRCRGAAPGAAAARP